MTFSAEQIREFCMAIGVAPPSGPAGSGVSWARGSDLKRTAQEPVEHPLSRSLGPDWRWLPDAVLDTVLLLHSDGLYVEFPRHFIEDLRYSVGFCEALACELRRGVAAGMHGRRDLTQMTEGPEDGIALVRVDLVDVPPWRRVGG